MAFVIGLAAKAPIGCCLNIVGTIIECIEVAKENDEMCGRICRYAVMLKGILEQLQGRNIPASSSIDAALHNLQRSLEKCKGYVADLDKRVLARPQHYLRARSDHRTLQGLRDEMSDGVGMMNAAVGSCSIMLQLDQRRESLRLHQESLYPNAGVYHFSYEENSTTSPYAEVVADNETGEFYLVIGWQSSSRKSDLTCYEVQYDETNGRSVRVDSDQTGVKLGKPKVYPGVFYHIRVREIYTSGSGKWSTTIPILMNSGPPNLNPELKVVTTSTTTATITVRRPTPEEENGSPITDLIVETRSPPDLQSTFKEIKVKVEPGPKPIIEKEISLEENATTTFFQVRLKNAAGTSPPSNEVRLTPADLVPGPPIFPKPTNDYIKRANDCIQIKWQQPNVNPKAVKYYQIDMRTKRKVDWKLYQTSDKLSVVVKGLESNKKYWFRVFAVNHRGVVSSCSEELEIETKYGPKARRVVRGFATVGAFLGGIPAAPIVMAAAPIVNAASVYEDTEEHKTAAAIAVGVGAAVLTVVASPFVVLGSPFAFAKVAYDETSALIPDEISDD